MIPEYIIQGIILTGACVTWWFLTKREVDKRKWGFVVMLCTQPFWLITSWRNGQWAVIIITVIYVVSALKGIRSHFWNGGG